MTGKKNNSRKNNKPKKQAKASTPVKGATKIEPIVPETPIVTSFASNISVEIDREVFEKIMYWIDKAPGEVSGLGKVEIENGVFTVTSAILLEQENTAVSTDLDANAVAKAMFELKDEPGKLNWWWHSHVNMGVFWSGTDVETIHELGKHGWFTATVFNKRREMKSAYYQKGGTTPEIFIEDIDTNIEYMAEDGMFKQWDEEYDKKVKEKKFGGFPQYGGGAGFPGHHRNFEYNEYNWDDEGYKIPELGGPGFYDATLGGEPNRSDGYVNEGAGFDGPYNDFYGDLDDLEDQYDEDEISELIAAEIERQEVEEKRNRTFVNKKTRGKSQKAKTTRKRGK